MRIYETLNSRIFVTIISHSSKKAKLIETSEKYHMLKKTKQCIRIVSQREFSPKL